MRDGETIQRERAFTRIDWPADHPSIAWFDVTGILSSGEELLELLEPHCPGLTAIMLQNLLTPDEKPTGQSYDNGGIKLASTFAVYPERSTEGVQRGEPLPAGSLVFQPVELLAGEDWLITCWHPTRTFRGSECRDDHGPPRDPGEIRSSLEAAWTQSKAKTAGDLGTLIMNELSLTYASAHRAIFAWLEDWELGFYMEDDRFDRHDLASLWGARAVFRDWLVPLNRPGITANPAKAWLPNANRELVTEVDDRIDRALRGLVRLGEALRSSFSLLHLQQVEDAREGNEALQRRIEIAAAAFLVPTLVVGFYGANTWVPGERQHWGFWVMVAALLAFTAFTVSLLRHWHKKQLDEKERDREERAKMRAELFRAP